MWHQTENSPRRFNTPLVKHLLRIRLTPAWFYASLNIAPVPPKTPPQLVPPPHEHDSVRQPNQSQQARLQTPVWVPSGQVMGVHSPQPVAGSCGTTTPARDGEPWVEREKSIRELYNETSALNPGTLIFTSCRFFCFIRRSSLLIINS